MTPVHTIATEDLLRKTNREAAKKVVFTTVSLPKGQRRVKAA